MALALSKVLQEKDDEVNTILSRMEQSGIGQMGRNFIDKALRPMLQGIVVAHSTGTNPDEIEDAIMNVALLSWREYSKRMFHKREDVLKAAQSLINEMAKVMGENIDLDFPANPTLILPETGKIDG